MVPSANTDCDIGKSKELAGKPASSKAGTLLSLTGLFAAAIGLYLPWYTLSLWVLEAEVNGFVATRLGLVLIVGAALILCLGAGKASAIIQMLLGALLILVIGASYYHPDPDLEILRSLGFFGLGTTVVGLAGILILVGGLVRLLESKRLSSATSLRVIALLVLLTSSGGTAYFWEEGTRLGTYAPANLQRGAFEERLREIKERKVSVTGVLTINTDVPDAGFYLDGARVGTGKSIVLDVPWGIHNVQAIWNGRTQTRELDMRIAYTANLEFSFRSVVIDDLHGAKRDDVISVLGTLGHNVKLVCSTTGYGSLPESAQVLAVFYKFKMPSYSDKELHQIRTFVEQGGGLLLAGEGWVWLGVDKKPLDEFPLNQLAMLFDGSFSPGYAVPPLRLMPSPLTEGTETLMLGKPGAEIVFSTLKVAPSWQVLAKDSKGAPVIGVRQYGRGKVALIGHDLLSPGGTILQDSGNAELVHRVISCLSSLEVH